MPIIPSSLDGNVSTTKEEPSGFQLSTVTIILIAVGAVVSIYVFFLIMLRYRNTFIVPFLRVSKSIKLKVKKFNSKTSSSIKIMKQKFSTKNSSSIYIENTHKKMLESSNGVQEYLQNRKGSFNKSLTEPNLSDATIIGASVHEISNSQEISQKRKKSIVGPIQLEVIKDISSNEVTKNETSIEKKKASIHQELEYPLPRRYSTSDWLRLMEDVISLIKPNVTIEYPEFNYISFEEIKEIRKFQVKLSPARDKSQQPPEGPKKIEDSPSLITKTPKNTITIPLLKENPEEVTKILKEYLNSIFQETDMSIPPNELFVNYKNTLGTDPYGALHLGVYNKEIIHVQCYYATIQKNSVSTQKMISDRDVDDKWSKEEMASIWLNELEVMRIFTNSTHALKLLGASVMCYKNMLYGFIAYEEGKPLVELIFNFDVDWHDDDVMYMACDVISALNYAHDFNIFGGLTLLDVWLVPKRTRGSRIFLAKVGGHFGAPLEFLIKRRDTSKETFRQLIYTRYLEPCDTLCKQNDMFSFAMLMYEALERIPGFFLYSKEKIMASLEEKKRPSINLQRSLANSTLRNQYVGQSRGVRVKLIEILTRCWSRDLKKRPSSKSTLEELTTLEEEWNL
ncbi:hypothetical protein HMI54_004317 [Coelomomyces lativittatus]|nr:hypothetical protein HMI56_000880 [Coelomomyces lativittatus]KAJ1506238.1 hypothetical protein HMI55_001259 [Coelomomyces lativittatus]KAJ1507298.1 hypothetical protein HMI54_004317 [Coelomomyces lativittatus]